DASWEFTEYSFSESVAANSVAIIWSGSSSVILTITIEQASATDSATEGIDFAPVPRSVTISGSKTSIPIFINEDNIPEPGESFLLTLSGECSATSTTRITINDNDVDDPPTNPPITTSSPGLGGGAIAGISIAAIIGAAGIVGAIAFVFCVLCRGRLRRPTPYTSDVRPAVGPAPLGYSMNGGYYVGYDDRNDFNRFLGGQVFQ
ncbi:uncharacterized protein, partial [Amphiura filiformis]|uniref:uncharacterized protein n=1 Tax=Amphiura filiformis TaxID=82378 RepID=UPI003B20FC92